MTTYLKLQSIPPSFPQNPPGNYRFGFNAMESEGSFYGDGNAYDFGARMYDGRLGRWWSVDPMLKKYPSYSPYHGFGGCPIYLVDHQGMELRIAGQIEQAFEDVMDLLPTEYKTYLKVVDGSVKWDEEKMKADDVGFDNADPGLALVNKLITMPEVLEYNVADEVTLATARNRDGERATVKIHSNLKTGESLIIYSTGVTDKFINTGVENAAKPLKNGGVLFRSGTLQLNLYEVPLDETLDGQVTVGTEFNNLNIFGDPKSRQSAVFHELAEGYYRTHHKQGYGEAHENAKELEKKFDASDPRRDTGSEGLSRKKQK